MKEVENKKQTPESPARPENKKIYYRPRPYARFTPKLKEATKLLQKSFPKLFTHKPEPKYALKIGIYNDLLSWASELHFIKRKYLQRLRLRLFLLLRFHLNVKKSHIQKIGLRSILVGKIKKYHLKLRWN